MIVDMRKEVREEVFCRHARASVRVILDVFGFWNEEFGFECQNGSRNEPDPEKYPELDPKSCLLDLIT